MEQNGRRVVEIEVASHLGGGRLDAVDVTAHRPLQVDLVDEVHQQRSRASGTPPLGFVVAVGLPHRDHRVGGDEPPDVVGDARGCRFDEVVVATVLPDEQVDAVVRRNRAQLLPGSERVGDRLLDEQVDAVAGEERADLEMKLVRRGDDDAVDVPVDQLVIVGVQRHAELAANGRRTVIEAGQSDQRHVRASRCQRGVEATDRSRADDPESNWLHDRSVVSVGLRHVESPPWTDEIGVVPSTCRRRTGRDSPARARRRSTA